MLRSLVVFLLLLPVPAFSSTLEVGPDSPHKTIASAVNASRAGDTVLIHSGTYENDFATINHALTLRGLGASPRLLATGAISNGKAILVVNADLVVQNLTFSNASVPDKNGAGIRHQSGNLTVQNSVFEACEDGILAASDPAANILIQDSHFIGNGYGDGYSHGIYINKVASLTVERSWFTETKAGHHIKSRARKNTIRQNFIDDGQTGASYAIDLPNGGQNIIFGNTIIQGRQAHNKTFINTGTAALHPSNALTIEDNTFINLANRGTALQNALPVTALIKSNTFYGNIDIVRGPADLQDNLVLYSLPENLETFMSWQHTLKNQKQERP